MKYRFGTDGIRGEAGKTVDAACAYLLGRALGEDGNVVVVGRDPRISGESLQGILQYGVASVGGQALNLGVAPTNAVSYFTREFGADYGVMISASHNPPQDNGLKVFDAFGLKLCPQKERVLELRMEEDVYVSGERRLGLFAQKGILSRYADVLLKDFPGDLQGLHLLADCCFGSAAGLAEEIFCRTGAEITCFNNVPDGQRINVSCGATHPLYLKAQGKGFDLGFSFDGDADRCVVLQGERILDDNRVFYAIAKYLKKHGLLCGPGVVGTVLTNGGAERALQTQGLALFRANVGDRNVFAEACAKGCNFGGEASGHYLFCDRFSCSDGIYTALMVSRIYRDEGDLFAFTEEYERIPGVSRTVEVSAEKREEMERKRLFETWTKHLRARFGIERLFVRPSGTEAKVRIYVESPCRQTNLEAAEYAESLVRREAVL